MFGLGDIVNLFVPPGQRTPLPKGPIYPPAVGLLTPAVSSPAMTPEQQYAGGADNAGWYGTPGIVAPGDQLPENWPLNTPSVQLLRSPADGIFRKPIILPDSMLPPALQRSNPLFGHTTYKPNKWDYKILRQAAAWQWIASHGGLKSCCRIPELGAPIWEQPPWEVMPSQGVVLREMFSIAANSVSGGSPFNGTDTLVGSFRVPVGYDGVLNHIVTGFNGTGFEEGSGDIVWRVAVGARYAKNLGNITVSYGSMQTALLVPGVNIRLVSGQTVFLFANVPNNSPISFDAQSRITMAVFGWTYPHR